ncbi:MAG TPA: hypothetical protein VMU50_00665 [Polyangia bacterium]|nr:hypothetical protein [Polyangia bacterium]
MTLFAVGGAMAAPPAPKESARRLYQEAMSAYGLGDYAQAADLYEKAFAAKADPALLYNAAQAHRMAGHGDRALELYRNYLRLFPAGDQSADAQRHVDALSSAPAAAATAPPPAALPPSSGATTPAAAPPIPTPAANGAAAPPLPPPTPGPTETAPDRSNATPGADLTAQPAPPEPRAGRSRAWLWIAAGAVVAGGAVALALILSSGSAKDPSPTLGIVGPR